MRRIAATNRPRLTTTLVILAALFLSALPALAAPKRKETVIVKFEQVSHANDAKSKHGFKVAKSISRGNSVLLVVEGITEKDLKDKLKNEAGVQWVVRNSLVPLDGGETVLPLDGGETVLPLGPIAPSTNDQSISSLLEDGGETVLPLEERYQIKNAYATLAKWLAPSERLLLQRSFRTIGLYPSVGRATGQGVIVADLDTGADTCHEVLQGVVTFTFVDGADANAPENCATASTTPVPGFGHGTAVASMIRVVAPQATIWAMRVFDNSGAALISDIYEAVVFAADHGVNVINMSFGTTQPSLALEDAVNYARGRGVTLIAAGGNSNVEPLMYPAAIWGVKGTVAVDAKDIKASFSNYGREASLAAPGVGLWVAYPNHQLKYASGTSYASPLVAGEAALIIDAYHRMYAGEPSTYQIDMPLLHGVQSIDSLNPQYYYKLGRGRIYIPWALNGAGLPQSSTTSTAAPQ